MENQLSAIQSAKQNNKLTTILLLVNLVISLSIITFLLLGGSTSNESSVESDLALSRAVREYSYQVGMDSIVIKNDSVVRDTYSSSLEGTMKNISDTPLENISIIFRFILDGKTIDYRGTSFSYIGEGEELPFSIYIPSDFDYDKYEVFKISAKH